MIHPGPVWSIGGSSHDARKKQKPASEPEQRATCKQTAKATKSRHATTVTTIPTRPARAFAIISINITNPAALGQLVFLSFLQKGREI